MIRVKINWTGFVGGPGYTNLYFDDPGESFPTQAEFDGVVAIVDTWLDNWQASIPQAVNFLVDPTVELVHASSGEMYGFGSTSPDTARTGADVGKYSAAAGAVCNWYTNGIRNGRRIRGRTFMVPLGSGAMDTSGTIDNTRLTTLRAATATFIDAASNSYELGVWSRPSAPGVEDGEWHPVTAFTIPDMTAVLTSRRD